MGNEHQQQDEFGRDGKESAIATRRALTFVGALHLAVILYVHCSFKDLPERVPSGWDAYGLVSATLPKAALYGLGPMLLGLHALVSWLVLYLGRRLFPIESFQAVLVFLLFCAQVAVAAMLFLIVYGAQHPTFPLSESVFATMSLLIAVFGNYSGKVQSNLLIGIRTPWTLMDRRVWDQTARISGRLLVMGGALGFCLSWIAPLWAVTSVLAASFISASLYSFVLYRRFRSEGGRMPPGGH